MSNMSKIFQFLPRTMVALTGALLATAPNLACGGYTSQLPVPGLWNKTEADLYIGAAQYNIDPFPNHVTVEPASSFELNPYNQGLLFGRLADQQLHPDELIDNNGGNDGRPVMTYAGYSAYLTAFHYSTQPVSPQQIRESDSAFMLRMDTTIAKLQQASGKGALAFESERSAMTQRYTIQSGESLNTFHRRLDSAFKESH